MSSPVLFTTKFGAVTVSDPDGVTVSDPLCSEVTVIAGIGKVPAAFAAKVMEVVQDELGFRMAPVKPHGLDKLIELSGQSVEMVCTTNPLGIGMDNPAWTSIRLLLLFISTVRTAVPPKLTDDALHDAVTVGKAAGFTVTVADPYIELVTVSVAVIVAGLVELAGVSSTIEKFPTPLVSLALPGKLAYESELVKCTMPV